MMQMSKRNTKKRAQIIVEIVVAYHEPGRHDRCLDWVYRNMVYPVYPISRSTFYRYLNLGGYKRREAS